MLRIPRPGYLHRLYMSRRQVSSTTLREIEQVLTCYELGRWRLVGPLLGGRSSYNFLLKTDRGEKVLKKYRWSLPAISREHAILCYLNDTDFPFPRVMLNRDGGTCTELNGERYAIYVFIRGFRYDDYYMPAMLSHRFIAQAGETLAHFHQLMGGFVPEGRKIDGFGPDEERLWRDTAWHLDALEQYVGGIKRDSPNSLDSLVLHNLDKLRRDLTELGRWHDEIHPQWSKQVIHSDYVAKNIVFDSRGVVGVLDLSSAVLDLRMLDIARALQSFARRGRYGLDASRARIFLDAYQTRALLPDDEVALIPKLSRWRLLRILIWRLREDLPSSRKLMSFRNRWAKARWLEKNEQRFLDALLAPRDHPRL
jgi:Ser/Thr protein kinase RdoA (MazF antagonist)